ncbi:MAG TPA: tail fiber protein [Bacteroidia bacterium]|nr:tail fiber protein [Bacteroidia bacterium]
MDEYIGILKIFAGLYAPQNYLNCDGTLLPINQYQALFSIIGTTYGGNGTSNFALPDLRACVPIGITGSGPAPQPPMTVNQGQKGGSSSVAITVNNMPLHTHTATLNVNSGNSANSVPVAGNSIATPGTSTGHGQFTGTLGFNAVAPNIALSGGSVINAPIGGSQPINTQPPYLGIRYIICINGIFPPRP